MARVLIVDDHLEMAEVLAEALAESGFQTETLSSARAALARLEAGGVDALVTDLRMKDLDGLALLAGSRRLDPNRPVIVMTAYGAIDSAVESIRQGAYHYLTKPFQPEELEIFLRRALEERDLQAEAKHLRRALQDQFSARGLVGRSPAMREVYELMERLAAVDVPVLLKGETGTGKGLVAGAIHAHGPRAKAPFVPLNCAALPEALLESELFGHAKGAFTGATSERAGLFAEAHGGTLFLDEIGEMPLSLQAKLLHVLERGTIRPVGASRERPVDVRILAATHRDLQEMVRQQRFREDLLYRLDVVAIDLPALRHRKQDIPDLVDHFLEAFRAKYPHSPVQRFCPQAMARLMDYAWPGNVRELSHVVQRAVVLGKGPEVGLEDLPSGLRQPPTPAWEGFSEILPVREVQRRYAAWALERLGGSKGRTAEHLGIDAKTLNKWLSEAPEAERRTEEDA